MASDTGKVVQGRWVSSREWLDFQNTITAPSPFDKQQTCRLRVATMDLLRVAEYRRRQVHYAFWSMVAGMAPPVTTQEADPDAGLTSILSAHACFQGVKRPVGADSEGSRVVAYVMKPKWFYQYTFLAPIVLTEKKPVPPDVVFVVFAHLDEPGNQSETIGVITHWQFIEADDRNGMLPAEFDTRYATRLW